MCLDLTLQKFALLCYELFWYSEKQFQKNNISKFLLSLKLLNDMHKLNSHSNFIAATLATEKKKKPEYEF